MGYTELIEGYDPGFYLGTELPGIGEDIYGMPVTDILNATQSPEGIHFDNGHITLDPTDKTLPRETFTYWVKYDGDTTTRGSIFKAERGDNDYAHIPWTANRNVLYHNGQILSITPHFFTVNRFPGDTWRHVAVVRSGTDSWSVYINGSLIGSANEASSFRWGATVSGMVNLTIGAAEPLPHTYSMPMKGVLSGLAFLPSRLTQAQLHELYTAGPPERTHWFNVFESGSEASVRVEGETLNGAILPLKVEGTYNATTQTVDTF